MQKCILILGMHRSGTSCLAGSLQNRGLYLGDVHLSNPHNKKGNRENQDVVNLNDSILAFNDAKWDVPPKSQVDWGLDHVNQMKLIVSRFESTNSEIWGFKDPRTLLTLRFWTNLLEVFELVGTVRHPLLVAQSLQLRNGFEISQALDLWFSYNSLMLRALRDMPFPVVSFDGDKKRYVNRVQFLSEKFKLKPSQPECMEFYDDSLIKQVIPNEFDLPERIKIVYKEILEYVI